MKVPTMVYERSVVLFTVIHLFLNGLFGQNIKFENISSRNGLPSNEVVCIIQDQKGFMWFATDNGLVRYDGYEFTVFRHEPNNPNSLSNNVIKTIFEDQNGYLWIGTDGGGLNIFNPRTETFIRYLDHSDPGQGLSSKRVFSISGDAKGLVWIGTYEGSLHYVGLPPTPDDYSTLAFRTLDLRPEPAKEMPPIFTLFNDSEENLWIGTSGGGVYVLPPAAFQSQAAPVSVSRYQYQENDPNSISGNFIRAIFEDRDKNIWIGTEFSGLTRISSDKQAFRRYSYSKADRSGINNNFISSILEDSCGRLWFGTRGGGLLLFDERRNQFIKYVELPGDDYSIQGNLINTIYEDRFGNIWLGMVSTGINQISRCEQEFSHFYAIPAQQHTLKGKLVKSILVDQENQLWVGTYGGGLNQYLGNGKFKHFLHDPSRPASLSNDNVQKIYEDKAGRLWIGTDGGGLNLWNSTTSSFTIFKHDPEDSTSLSGNSVWSIFEDSGGNFWIGTQDGGLNKFDREKQAFRSFRHDPDNPYSISSNDIRVIYEDRLGMLWIGTYGGGLNRFFYEEERFESYQTEINDPGSIGSNKITSIFESPTTGQLWIGTFGGGVASFDRTTGSFQNYTEEEGLSNNMVKSIEEDERGHLWISTQKGISLFDTKEKTFRNFTVNDGLQDDAFSLGSSFKDKNGYLYFGGANGFNRFHPNDLSTISVAPRVYITDLLIQNRSIKPGQQIDGKPLLESSLLNHPPVTLPYHLNSFTLKFNALTYSFQDQIQYAYQLEGVDKDWIHTSADLRSVNYSNLYEGKYHFKIKAKLGNSAWSEITSLPISIHPPFFRSKVAYLGYFALLLTLGWIIRRVVRTRIALQNQLKIERIERNKIKEINEFKLNFFTSISHEIRTPLTLIKGPVEELLETESGKTKLKAKLHTIHSNTNRLLSLVNQILDFRKYDSGKMDLHLTLLDPVQFVNDLLPYFNGIAHQKNIHLSVFSNKENILVYFDKMQMEKVFINLISNAFKFTPENGRIHIYVSTKEDAVSITIEDNGKGIPEKHIAYIFDRFYQAENINPGDITSSGLGLAIAKEIVELHQGSINVQSQPHQFTKFEVLLPLNRSLAPAADTVQDMETKRKNAVKVLLEENNATSEEAELEQLHSILIIDDNLEILDFLNELFCPLYHVITSASPLKGLESALDQVPDLIILDLMMPGMDGMEVCQRLKENIRTSHIPIILLTAKDSVTARLGMYKAGADDYITKPFNVSLLKMRVKNLIDSRQKLRALFNESLALEPSEIAIPSPDQQFLQEVIKVVEENIPNAEFSVDDLAREVGLSRAVFYRKLPALTGYTPNDFIRTMRLKRAEQLLKKSDLTVKEISFQVGFNSPKYFSQKFRHEYGESPANYAKQFTKPTEYQLVKSKTPEANVNT